MSFNWIDPKDFSINSILLMEEFIIEQIAKNNNPEFQMNLSVVLHAHPAIHWYCKEKAPNVASYFDKIVQEPDSVQLSDAELYIIDALDWAIVLVYPDVMEGINYITEWDEQHLFEMEDFTDKTVLDIGAGTGRLAFAAAKKARMVYASEPVERLRRHMKHKIKEQSIDNMIVLDGTVEDLPFDDDMFDIVMSGHVVEYENDKEFQEITRVLKDGGSIIDCPGEDHREKALDEELVKRGFQYTVRNTSTGGRIYQYYKRVCKSD